jgi:hypothetical protein
MSFSRQKDEDLVVYLQISWLCLLVLFGFRSFGRFQKIFMGLFPDPTQSFSHRQELKRGSNGRPSSVFPLFLDDVQRASWPFPIKEAQKN